MPPTSSRWTTATSSNTRAAAPSLPLDDFDRQRHLDVSAISTEDADRRRQGRRQALRHQPRRQLGRDDGQHRRPSRRPASTLPDRDMTWDDYADARRRADQEGRQARLLRLGRRRRRTSRRFENWLRQRGKALYDADGKLGFDADDATEWFEMWAEHARQPAPASPPTIQALDQLHASRPACSRSGKAAVAFATPTSSSASRRSTRHRWPCQLPARRRRRRRRPLPQAVDVLQRLANTGEAGRGGEVRQLLRQRPGRRPRCSASSAAFRLGGGARGVAPTLDELEQDRARTSCRTSATCSGRCRRRRRPAPARSTVRC